MPSFQSLHNPKNKPLRAFTTAPLPTAAQAEFEKAKTWLNQSSGPLYVEVGCGAGLHPILWSQKNPKARLFAFERTSEKYEKARRRFRNNGSPANVHIVHADAAVMLPYLLSSIGLASESSQFRIVHGFYFLYPNPYPKTSQANLRLAHSPFLHFVRESLVEGGSLTLATNSASYAFEAQTLIPHYGFTPQGVNRLSADFSPRSHFEKKYLARGEKCFDLVFTRIEASPLD